MSALVKRSGRASRTDDRLELVFDANPQPAFIFHRKTLRILAVNRTAIRRYGYSRREWLGMKMSDLRPAGERAALARAVARLGRSVRRLAPTRHRLKNRRIIPVEIDAQALTWNGEPAVLSVVIDVTRQQTMEEDLRGARERLGEIVGNVPIILFAVDAKGVVQLSEGKGLSSLGARSGETVGRAVEDVYAGNSDALSALKRALAGESFTATFHVRGRAFETHFAPRFDAQGRPAGFMGVSTDVTERKRADVLLHQQSAAIKASIDGMSILDSGGRFIFLNEAHAKLHGYSAPRELIGKSWQHLYDADETARFEAEVLPTVRRAGQWRGDAIGKRKDGSTFPQEASLTSTEEGELVFVVRDVTARKQADAEHARLFALEKKARADAEAASQAKDEFLAVVSHELRTPMTAILGWTWLLRSGDVGSADHDRALEVIERNMKLQAQIIEDLLDMSSVVTGKIHLETRPISAARVMEAALETIRGPARARKIEVISDLDKEVVVFGDPQRLQQVCWNLLSNAVKFNKEGGRLTARVRRDSGCALLAVEDTGDGISPDFLPDMFDPLRQAEGSLTRQHRGLGIGLAIVRHLVELHGGSVSVSSAGPGKGAAFSVVLPLAQAAAEAAPAARPSQDGKGLGSRLPHSLDNVDILLIDDELDTIEVLRELLKYCGATVRTALSAAEGFESLTDKRPDVLICDIAMPQEDGYSLIRRIRRLPARDGGEVRALALTAMAKDEDRQHALEAGFQAYLAKPVDPAALVSTIKTLVRQ